MHGLAWLLQTSALPVGRLACRTDAELRADAARLVGRSGGPAHCRSLAEDCSTTQRTEFAAATHERGSPDACLQRTSKRHLPATPVQPERRHRRRADEGQRRCAATIDASRCRRCVCPQHQVRKTPARAGGRRPFDEDERRRPPGLSVRRFRRCAGPPHRDGLQRPREHHHQGASSRRSTTRATAGRMGWC